MSQAERVIHLLGGVRKTAEIVGAPLTTVQSWRDGGFIPARRQQRLIEEARKVGISIGPNDFFEALPVVTPAPAEERAA